ncbi:hypothetical protein IGB42_03311 [Andreprevotia sp. IGB-42]|uniref:hypothetical protein n=1 Tax=Andreprevotia sp. IGB-42 TaxID=2497473 RepID=UPI001357542D|nr:hypothetical protein [Andreprevotia sp. IGB-42]KAF0812321.1 hypothetical protein IGB42_03311 [Andreprevotia sp. IGB-42]
MPVLPDEFATLIAQVQESGSLRSYQAAQRLEILKPEMTDAQRTSYSNALGQAAQVRQKILDEEAEREKAERE